MDTIQERIALDADNTTGDICAFEIIASCECIGTNARHVITDRHAGKVTAIFERVCTDGSYFIADRNTDNACMTIECVLIDLVA